MNTESGDTNTHKKAIEKKIQHSRREEKYCRTGEKNIQRGKRMRIGEEEDEHRSIKKEKNKRKAKKTDIFLYNELVISHRPQGVSSSFASIC